MIENRDAQSNPFRSVRFGWVHERNLKLIFRFLGDFETYTVSYNTFALSNINSVIFSYLHRYAADLKCKE